MRYSDYAVNKNLFIAAEALIPATAANPLNGMSGYAGTRSVIVGGSQIGLQTLASPLTDLPNLLIATGSVSTTGGYSKTRVGNLAKHRHSLGFTFVETDGDRFWASPVEANEAGEFTVRSLRIVKQAPYVDFPLAIVAGDDHMRFRDETLLTEYKRLSQRVSTIVRHDIIDFNSQNHHNVKDLKTRYQLSKDLEDSVFGEVYDCVTESQNWYGGFENQIIVHSNHHEALDRWIDRYSPLQDPKNLATYVQILKDYLEDEDKISFFHSHFKKLMPGSIFLSPGEGYEIAGVDIGAHGHVGENGGRGSRTTIYGNYKVVTAHTHAPGWYRTKVTAGCSCQRVLGYMKGYSAALQAWVPIYSSGSRSIHAHIDGRSQAVPSEGWTGLGADPLID
jgi:hypothetical protein